MRAKNVTFIYHFYLKCNGKINVRKTASWLAPSIKIYSDHVVLKFIFMTVRQWTIKQKYVFFFFFTHFLNYCLCFIIINLKIVTKYDVILRNILSNKHIRTHGRAYFSVKNTLIRQKRQKQQFYCLNAQPSIVNWPKIQKERSKKNNKQIHHKNVCSTRD